MPARAAPSPVRAQAAHDRKRKQLEADIQLRDHQSRALAAQAATDAATAAKLKAGLEARFAILRQAGVLRATGVTCSVAGVPIS